MADRPKVSVLLPVYNGGRYLSAAIESILAQSFDDFELIVINDGSTDDSASTIRSFSDRRLRYVEQVNQGLSATLNNGIQLARGEYVARQDADDVSHPGRIGKQAAYLDANPDCGIVGCWAEIWCDDRPTDRWHRHPADDATLKFELLFNNPFVHSSMMIRKSVFAEVGMYSTDASRQPPEDYELWSRVARRYHVANIPEVLHVYRETPGSICRKNWERIMDIVAMLSAENIAFASALDAPDAACCALSRLANGMSGNDAAWPELRQLEQRFSQAVEWVRGATVRSPDGTFERAVGNRWSFIKNQYRIRRLLPLFRTLRALRSCLGR